MFATSIEIDTSSYNALRTPYDHLSPVMPTLGPASGPRLERSRRRCCRCCMMLMWRLIDCFRSNSHEEQIRTGPVVLESHVAQYQAPIVTPSPRAGSVTYIDEDHVAERGTLLPKRQTPESSRHGAASTSAAATATATLTVPATEGAGVAALEPPRHRRTGSDCSRGKPHIEGVRAKVVTTSACGAKGNKFGSKSQQEFSTITELLGANIDDEDFCPTCLEPYTDDNPKIFTRCGHAFHMQCIYAWLERKSTCPLCESPMDLQDDVLL